MNKLVDVEYAGTARAIGQVDASEFASTGNALPTGRLLDGSRDHGYATEYYEPGTIRGNACHAVYLFDQDEVDAADERNGEEDLPWDDAHTARIILDDTEDWE